MNCSHKNESIRVYTRPQRGIVTGTQWRRTLMEVPELVSLSHNYNMARSSHLTRPCTSPSPSTNIILTLTLLFSLTELVIEDDVIIPNHFPVRNTFLPPSTPPHLDKIKKKLKLKFICSRITSIMEKILEPMLSSSIWSASSQPFPSRILQRITAQGQAS